MMSNIFHQLTEATLSIAS